MKKTIFIISMLALLPVITHSAEVAIDHNEMLLNGVKSGNLQQVREALKNGAHTDYICQNDLSLSSPLHLATERGYTAIVSELIKAKANIEASDFFQCTPLHIATQKCYFSDTVNALIESRAEINARNRLNSTPLHYAAIQGRIDIINLLLKKQATIDALNNDQCTPLHYAAAYGKYDAVSRFLECGANDKLKTKIDNCDVLGRANKSRGEDNEITVQVITEYITLRESVINEIPQLILTQTTIPLPLGNLIAQYCYAFCES